MIPVSGPAARRFLVLVGWSIPLLVACAGGPRTPAPTAGGPQFVVQTPDAGSETAGTFFFAVQPLDPDEVVSVRFLAGATALGTDTSAADGFRTFVVAAEHAAGPLDLTAEATGRDGRVSSRTVRVTNVPSPPASRTVGADGAALGTREADGSLSTMIVPPNAVSGTTIAFTARTQAQVTDDTGVDYDALGITFLGAQAIESGEALTRTPTIASGGFGPRVQPGQAVVNYMIGPDADGDGVGEIVVANSASVAPNGDVISDPLPRLQVGATASLQTAGRSGLRPLSAGLAGPPGTVIELPVSGFNASSPYGSVAIFEAGGARAELVGSIRENEAGAQTFATSVPALRPGRATLTLLNVGTGAASEPIDVEIEAAEFSGTATAAIEGALDSLSAAMRSLDAASGDLEGGFADLGETMAAEMRRTVAALNADGSPEALQSLDTIAASLAAGDVERRFAEIEAELAGRALRTSQAGCNDILDRADTAFNLVGNAGRVGYPSSPQDIAMGEMQGWMIGQWWSKIRDAADRIDDALGGNGCRPPKPPPGGPGGPSSPSGMGAAVPPGGSLGGGAWGGGSGMGGGSAPYLLAPQASSSLEQERGRYVVKLSSQTSTVPFSGATDAGGYFFIPMVPAHEPFVATAFDTRTGETRTIEGTGPEVGEAHYLLFDFSTGSSETAELRWDGGGDGVRWNDPHNWAGDLLPLPHHDVIIDAPGATIDFAYPSGTLVPVHSLTSTAGLTLTTGTLAIAAASSLDGPLALRNGVLNLTGDLVAEGDVHWTSGTVGGTGTFVNRGRMTIESGISSNPRTFTGSIRNEGEIVLTGTASSGLRTGAGARIVNAAGGVFETRDDVGIVSGEGDPPATLDNHGTLLKSSGSGTASWRSIDVNHLGGTVEVRSGTLYLEDGGVSTGGVFEVATGATLAFGSHTREHTMTGRYEGSGAGVVEMRGGYFVFAEPGATLAFPSGEVHWSGASGSGTGTLTVTSPLHFVLEGVNAPQFTGHLVNQDRVVVRGTSSSAVRTGDGASFRNEAGAVFEFRDDTGLSHATGDPMATFVNAGTLLKSSGTGISSLGACYEGAGAVVEQAGTFDFRCGGP